MKPYVVGIDLGTSNTVVAYAEAGGDEIRVFDIEQLTAPGEVGAQPLLPSARYHPGAGELPASALQLPWPASPEADADQAVVVGRLARTLGAQVPGRLVASAKSWLSHASVDRLAPILPWGAPDDVGKVSPVDASASYLAHVRAAWNHRFPNAPLEQQDVVLTVPASFDDGARALTLEAARRAQLPELRLLEEPQAAFYDWLFHHRDSLQAELARTRLVLVCDVGGGTTDLTLIQVQVDENGEPRLTRVGVGNHLMLGGDNMDLALAHLAESRLAGTQAQAGRLSAASLSQLVERCRVAKEQLLDAQAPESVGVTLLGAGSKLIGGARSTQLTREEASRIVVDGFFPAGDASDLPRRARAGIVEFGLPYAADPAITRHIAAFLQRFAAQSREALGLPASDAAPASNALPVPDTLLLNGGVFKAPALSTRLRDTLGAWRDAPLTVLQNDHPDVAVARGAVAFALARKGRAPRIGGGSPRSYFLVLDEGENAGGETAQRGICLLPRGTEESHEVRLDDRTFALRLGHPVQFHLVSTAAETRWNAGEIADLSNTQGGAHAVAQATDFVRLPPLATVVAAEKGGRERPVKLSAQLTEVGTLEVRCIATDDPAQQWLLEFQLRRDEHARPDAGARVRHPALDEAIALIERVFGAKSAKVDPKEVKRLRAQLEHTLGPRQNWDSPLLRELFGALWDRAGRRRRSADHERLWLNLAGYCVRPGFGYPLDEWRVEQLWTLFDDGIQHVNDSQVWSEWWTLWRRAAGGLNAEAQEQVLEAMRWLEEAASAKHHKLPFDPAKLGNADMTRLYASLEQIDAAQKVEIGARLLERLQKSAENPQSWWALGRIGARLPFYGSAHGVVPPEVAGQWLDAILALDWKKVEPAMFAAAQIARMTGDRSRDIAPELRETVLKRLESANAPHTWIEMVREVVELDNADTGRVFGEALPAGLKLMGS
ncbi:molecular chaperone DnaK (HSP70) [Paraburkholderia bannensis]|uniref:Molecular chaperone DnaK (HSP70) n=1 Tax=Paraburkholderia bannensis TaxID=765414 RepID=A0A7W9WVT7_9BURK|nr:MULTISPECIES: Hsp70 family protein [Paraburkholderia]MBB3260856.1 molecular chaperone DnaK (HSP70) [Paraburkholderia sp. WP4_3_2]MBB6105761.1 molecular chaperone DnaK (HSP70) [Paraburkholderia bannensis]